MIKAILFLWVVLLTATLIGWGCLGVRLLTRSKSIDEKLALPHALLVGLFFVTLQGLIANFWISLTLYAGIYTIFFGALLLALYRSALYANASEWLAIIAGSVWVVWGLPFDGLFNDAGLYHLQFEQWMARSPVLWGLANLQSRFGFDSSWLIFVSMTRIDLSPALSPWVHAIVADMMIRSFIFWWLLIGFSNASRNVDRFSQLFYGASFLLLSVFLWRMREAGTDIPANLIAIALWLIAYEAWQSRDKPSFQQGMAVIVASILIVTSKLSILPMILLAIPIIISARKAWKDLAPIAFVGVIFLVLWLFRNFMLTGCFIYPAAITCTNVEWGLGAEAARGEARAVTTFARIHMGPGIALERSLVSVESFSLGWLIDWIKNFPGTHYFRVTMLAIVVGLLGWFSWGRRQNRVPYSGFLSFSAVVALLQFLYWLILGPDPRFAWAMFYIVSVVSICWIGAGANYMQINNTRTINMLMMPLGVMAVGFLVGAFNKTPIDFYGFSVYEMEPFEYRGVTFYWASSGMCGESIPCVTEVDHKALDKVFNANPDSLIFHPPQL